MSLPLKLKIQKIHFYNNNNMYGCPYKYPIEEIIIIIICPDGDWTIIQGIGQNNNMSKKRYGFYNYNNIVHLDKKLTYIYFIIKNIF